MTTNDIVDSEVFKDLFCAVEQKYGPISSVTCCTPTIPESLDEETIVNIVPEGSVLCSYCINWKPREDCMVAGERMGTDMMLQPEYLCEECTEEIEHGEDYWQWY